MSEDYYRILGVDRDASTKEIKRAYRKQAAQYHPDVSDAANAEERFKQIKKAKEVLTDPDERARYDQLGHDRYEQAAKHGATGAGGGDDFGGMGGFGDIFEQFFGGRGRRNGPRRGQHIRTSVSLDLEEAYSGVRKRISITRPERCPECDGRGYPADARVQTCPQCQGSGQERIVQNTPFGRIQQTQTCRRCEGAGETYSQICPRCDGSGVSREQARLTVEIPAGIESSMWRWPNIRSSSGMGTTCTARCRSPSPGRCSGRRSMWRRSMTRGHSRSPRAPSRANGCGSVVRGCPGCVAVATAI
jgi:molecular chaperone DnaJ